MTRLTSNPAVETGPFVYKPATAGIEWYWNVAELEAMQSWQRMDAKIAQYGGCAKIPPPPYCGGDPG